jgi:hypothetical protein
MIGLVNSAGMSDLARAQAVDRAARDVVGIFVPIDRRDDGVLYQRLRSAIQRPMFSGTGGERKPPSGEESDRFEQAETESRSPASQVGGGAPYPGVVTRNTAAQEDPQTQSPADSAGQGEDPAAHLGTSVDVTA